MESKTAFVQSVLRFASDEVFNSQTQASMVTNAYSIYKKYLQYGDRDAARHWVIKNRSRYGYKVVKHDPDAFTCFCQADFTSDEDHECSLCKCHRCTHKYKYFGFPTIPKYRDVISSVLCEMKIDDYMSESNLLLKQISEFYYDECLAFPNRSQKKIYVSILYKILDLYSTSFEIEYYANLAMEDGCSIPPNASHLDGREMLRLIMLGTDINVAFNQAIVYPPITKEQALSDLEQEWEAAESNSELVSRSKENINELTKGEIVDCVMCQEEVTHFAAVCTQCKDCNDKHKAFYHAKCLKKWFIYRDNVRCGYCRNEEYLWV